MYLSSIRSGPTNFSESIDMAIAAREEIAQSIFDRTLPLTDGSKNSVNIPFEMWRDETKAFFLKLADMWIANENFTTNSTG